jgi:hypothetical protein
MVEGPTHAKLSDEEIITHASADQAQVRYSQIIDVPPRFFREIIQATVAKAIKSLAV